MKKLNLPLILGLGTYAVVSLLDRFSPIAFSDFFLGFAYGLSSVLVIWGGYLSGKMLVGRKRDK